MSYESSQLLSEYLLMHYGTEEQLMPWDFDPKKGSASPFGPLAIFQMLKSKTHLISGAQWDAQHSN